MENPELAPHEGIANQARVLSPKPRGEVLLEQQALFGAVDRECAHLGSWSLSMETETSSLTTRDCRFSHVPLRDAKGASLV